MTPVADPLVVLVSAGIIVLAAWGLTFAVMRAARYPHPTAMVTALALLTLLALLGLGLADGEASNTFGTLAATGMGALAGAVTSTFQNKSDGGKEDGQDGQQE